MVVAGCSKDGDSLIAADAEEVVSPESFVVLGIADRLGFRAMVFRVVAVIRVAFEHRGRREQALSVGRLDPDSAAELVTFVHPKQTSGPLLRCTRPRAHAARKVCCYRLAFESTGARSGFEAGQSESPNRPPLELAPSILRVTLRSEQGSGPGGAA